MILPENIRRIFLAVPAPSETEDLIEGLKRKFPAQKALKWMRPQNLHITIFFIGNIERQNYNLIRRKCEEVISDSPPFRLMFDGLTAMPSQKPHMLWAKYKTNVRYTEMYHSIHNSIAPYINGGSKVYENPVPHITLARFHGVKSIDLSDISSDIVLPEVHVNEFCMWETESRPGQSDYRQDNNCFKLRLYNE